MATYGDLKTRIAAEMIRDDLSAGEENAVQLANAILSAVRHYRVRDWWFLTTSVTTPTVASQNYITRPTGIEIVQRVSIPSLNLELCKEDITCIEAYDEPTAQTGQPESYAEFGAQLRLWPTPNAVYTMKITGTAALNELSVDADTNAWTNTAQDLICAAAKARLYRFFRDPEGENNASREEALALSALDLANVDRLDGPVRASW
jgi:hypothetical protein